MKNSKRTQLIINNRKFSFVELGIVLQTINRNILRRKIHYIASPVIDGKQLNYYILNLTTAEREAIRESGLPIQVMPY